MKIRDVPIDQVVPYDRNPRRNEEAVPGVAESIREFGWQQPIVVDADMVVIIGHTRLKAARLLGLDVVPIHVADDLPPEKVQALRLADNKVGERAEWDEDMLIAELRELSEAGLDPTMSGFSQGEIDAFFALADRVTSGNTDENDVPELPEEPSARLGDTWVVGRHRVRCGDSTNEADVAALLAGVRPLLMVTDPPYGVEYDPAWRNNALRANGEAIGARAVGKVSNDDLADWTEAWDLFPGDVAYVWHAGRFASEVQRSLEAAKFNVRAQIIWANGRFAISRGHYHWQHEPCWYAVRNGATGHWNGDRKQTTLWNISHNKSETGHGTQKPVECMRRPIENNSAPGQPVYDPFLGSGTTLIAAETTGRSCYGMELDPAYVDVIVRRWQDYTGQAATLEGDGRTYAEVADARRAA